MMEKPPRRRIHGIPVWVLILLTYLILPAYAAATLLAGWAWQGLIFGGLIELAALIVLVRGVYGEERVHAWAHRLSPWVQIVAFFAVAALVQDAKGQMQFYAVTAQLIPVLALALIVQTRAFSLKGRTTTEDIWGVLLIILGLAAGETSALVAVFRGTPTPAGLIAGAIGAAFAGLLINALLPRESEQSETAVAAHGAEPTEEAAEPAHHPDRISARQP